MSEEQQKYNNKQVYFLLDHLKNDTIILLTI